MFEGETDVVEVPDELDNEKSQATQDRDWLHDLHNRDMKKLRKVVTTLKKMENFSETKKNMFFPIRDGVRVTVQTLEMLKTGIENRDGYHFKYHLKARMVLKIK